MQRLRPLSEAECYTRLYGKNGESAVNLLVGEPAVARRPALSGDDLRRLLEERLDAREPDIFDGEAAA